MPPKRKCSICAKRIGRGTPPVCNICYENGLHLEAEKSSFREILDQLTQHPTVQNAINKSADAVNDRFSRFMDQLVDNATKIITGQREDHHRPISKTENPRIVMGFGPEEVLTVEKIKQRQKDLAHIMHPDKGGSTEAMQRLNVAVDELIKGVK